MEVPSKVDYDFLLVALGIAAFLSPYYLKDYFASFPFSLMPFFFQVGGMALFVIGIDELKYNYYTDTHYKENNYRIDLRRKNVETAKLVNENIKYFEKEGLLDAGDKERLIGYIKYLIKQNT
ncbi:MAG: hypothetical protein ABIF85_06120 [Nanoarchaeota archaeon]